MIKVSLFSIMALLALAIPAHQTSGWASPTSPTSPTVPAESAGHDQRIPASVNVYSIKNVAKTRIYIQCPTGNEDKILQVRKKLIAHGAEKTNLFLPALIVCEIRADADVAGIIDDPDFKITKESAIDAAASRPGSREIEFARSCYDLAQRDAAWMPEAVPIDFNDVVMTVPKSVVRRTKELQRSQNPNVSSVAPRTIQQNSEFLIGDVLVQAIFPESDGSQENWTDEELTDASSAAFSGAIAFQQMFHYVPIDFIFKAERRVETSYEPILHNLESDSLWILDVMRNLVGAGSQSPLPIVHYYNNGGRAGYGTDWVFTAFVARSENQYNHRFQDAGYTAYAYLGGPYLVIPFPAGRLHLDYEVSEKEAFSRVFQHEMGHIFWALDEYPGSPPCDFESGYLCYRNLNSVDVSPAGEIVACPDYVPCMMLGVMGENRPICDYTAGQLGLANADRNDVPDIFDSPPVVEFENSMTETVLVSGLEVNMRVVATAVPNQNPRQDEEDRIDYTAPLKDAVLHVNDIGSVWLKPLDGRWDEVEEDLSFKISGLEPGLTRIQVRVRNVFGCSSENIEKRIYFIGLKLARFDLNVEEDGIRINWHTIGETFGAQLDLYRLESHGGMVDTLLLATDIPSTGEPNDLWKTYEFHDRDVTPGNEYRYFVRGHFTLSVKGEQRDFETQSNLFTVKAMFPIANDQFISQVSPNPFRQSTKLSIDVPKSYTQMETGDGPGESTGLKTEVPTDLQVTAYDVRGRAVKEIFSGKMLSQVKTLEWDGTNTKNEPVASGVYFLRISAGPYTEVKKVVVLR